MKQLGGIGRPASQVGAHHKVAAGHRPEHRGALRLRQGKFTKNQCFMPFLNSNILRVIPLLIVGDTVPLSQRRQLWSWTHKTHKVPFKSSDVIHGEAESAVNTT